MILTNSAVHGHRMLRHFAGLCDLYFHPSLFTLPARLRALRKGRRDPHPLLDGAYILQMIIYAIVVHLANTVSWTVAMMFTALYSLTFFGGHLPSA